MADTSNPHEEGTLQHKLHELEEKIGAGLDTLELRKQLNDLHMRVKALEDAATQPSKAPAPTTKASKEA